MCLSEEQLYPEAEPLCQRAERGAVNRCCRDLLKMLLIAPKPRQQFLLAGTNDFPNVRKSYNRA